MSRILKRPMFRKGGTPNEGIMSGLQEPRLGFLEGGVTVPDAVGLPEAISQNRPGIFRRIIQALNPSTETIIKRARDVYEAPYLFEGIFDPAVETLQFRTPEEETAFYEKFPKLKLPETKTEPTEEPKPELEVGPEKAPKSDAETIKEYMNMFKTALAGDEDEITRQKYLQLAQFGANILAQPGGDLVGAIGKAAAPSIAELSKIQSREKAAEREAKVLGLQAAIQRLDPTKLEETVKYLQREMPGEPTEKLINMAIAGSTGKAQTQESRIQANAEALTGEIGQAPALKAARSMEIIGRNYAEFSLLPVDKEGKIKPDTPDGLYYDKKGNLSIIDKGVKSDIKIGSK